MHACQSCGQAKHPWLRALTDREQEILRFTQARSGQDVLICDLSQSLERASSSSKLSPCITPSAKLWHIGRSRLLMPEERLALQGLIFYQNDVAQFPEELLSGARIAV